MTHRFELRRRLDGLIYRFELDVGGGVYRRADRPDLTIVRDDEFGWVARDPDTQCLAGRVWDIPVAAQEGECPPEGRWVSSKGARSYVYDLTHLNGDHV